MDEKTALRVKRLSLSHFLSLLITVIFKMITVIILSVKSQVSGVKFETRKDFSVPLCLRGDSFVLSWHFRVFVEIIFW